MWGIFHWSNEKKSQTSFIGQSILFYKKNNRKRPLFSKLSCFVKIGFVSLTSVMQRKISI